MKLYNQGATPASATSPVSFAGLIEKIEILRSTLRWSSRLDRPEIEKLLKQATTLRDEVMGLSHKERFVQAASAEAAPPQEEVERMPRERRQALVERSLFSKGPSATTPSCWRHWRLPRRRRRPTCRC